MSFEVFITKYINQFKAINPKYDEVFEVKFDEPVVFHDSENVKASFACIADTHLVDNEAATVNLNNFFKDINNSRNKFDAVLMAGDISEYSRNKEYNRFFNVFDNYKND